ncbi:putative polygalacturonase [Drosera capensis]
MIQDTSNWLLVDPLPSYGRGREIPGGRYASFILGNGVHDVVITDENGTIDGQGVVWWDMWRGKTLQHTRPHLLELMYSKQILISNVIFKDSPFWNIHPVYCSNVVIKYVTILAPTDSPNTDGIDPDSSSNVCIEDSYTSTGDDLIAIKSGWDEYGIAFGRPSWVITIRRITGSSPFSGIAIGSETSGGVQNIRVEHVTLYNMGVGVHIKTDVGRGGYIRNVTMSNIYMENARKGIKIAGDVGDHPTTTTIQRQFQK